MSDPKTTEDRIAIEDLWCPDPAAYDRGECCGFREGEALNEQTQPPSVVRALAVRMAQELDVSVDRAEQAIRNLIALGLIKP